VGFDQGKRRAAHSHCAGAISIRPRRPPKKLRTDATPDLPTTLGEGKQSPTPVHSEPNRNSRSANADTSSDIDAAAHSDSNPGVHALSCANFSSHADGNSLSGPEPDCNSTSAFADAHIGSDIDAAANPLSNSNSLYNRLSFTNSFQISHSHSIGHSLTDHNHEHSCD